MQITRHFGLAGHRLRTAAAPSPKAEQASGVSPGADGVEVSFEARATPPSQIQQNTLSASVAGGVVGGVVGAATTENLRLILAGPPGAGKGTQSRFLREKWGGAHISTGAMLREEVANDTELGRKAKPYMDRGELVPDDIILDMVRGRLEKEDSFILDGFPRSVPQAQALDEMLVDLDKPLTSVVLLEVSDETILNRLLKRGRADDNEETIRNRIEVYRQQTEPMVEHFRHQGLVESVNVEGSIETNQELVTDRVGARLNRIIPNLDLDIPPAVLSRLKASPGPTVRELVDNLDSHVADGKAPYAATWSDEQKAKITADSKTYFEDALNIRPSLTLPEFTSAAKSYVESETLAIESSPLQAKWGGRAALFSAGLAGLGLLTGNSLVSLAGGAAFAGSLALAANGLWGIDQHKENVKQMGGTRDLIEGWQVALTPPEEQG